MRFGTCRILRRARPGQTYICRSHSRRVDAWRSLHDIELLLDGEPAISLSGLEMYRTRDNTAPQVLAVAANA